MEFFQREGFGCGGGEPWDGVGPCYSSKTQRKHVIVWQPSPG
jgi:hypothetical protein